MHVNATVTSIRRRDRSWRKFASCMGEDPALFDGPEDESPDVRAAREDVAKDICGSCPVASACLAFAQRMRATTGIWGGRNHDERLAHFRSLRRVEREAAQAAELEATG